MKPGIIAGAIAPMFAAWGLPGTAQEMTAQEIADASVIDVPFRLGEVDTRDATTSLWSRGDKPANSLLANITIAPVQAAIIDGQVSVLWRAFVGGGITILRADELDLTGAPRNFCGILPGFAEASCFIDEDGDGRFDQVADAIREGGTKPYHITIIRGARRLDTPLGYHVVADDQRPSVSVVVRNCGKDYDRPRFSALSTVDRDAPVASEAFVWQAKDSSFAPCRRGSKIASVEGMSVAAPQGGYIAEIGPLAFTVGPKKKPDLVFVGPVDGQALYRLEGARLVDTRVGRTPNQAKLLALKKFPYPSLMADGGAIHEGPVAPGETLATIPFRHAYRGRLTQDIAISTLLGKRSLAAGTVVYGFPSQSRLSRSVNGVPDIQSVGDDHYRKVDLELTWCAPVKEAAPEPEKPGATGKGGWSAACIPYSTLGNHTIIGDMQPAFGVESVSYRAATSSNDGPPPIERDAAAAFDQPLRLDYVFRGREGDFTILGKRIYSGDELTSEESVRLFAPDGKIVVEIAKAPVELSLDAGGRLSAHAAQPPVAGANPVLRWDQRAYILWQIQQMRMRAIGATAGESPVVSE